MPRGLLLNLFFSTSVFQWLVSHGDNDDDGDDDNDDDNDDDLCTCTYLCTLKLFLIYNYRKSCISNG